MPISVQILLVGLGGFLGAIARFGLSTLVHKHFHHLFPLGTLIVNILGCFAIGLLVGLIETREHLKLFLLTGLLGAFTTFSTFGNETFSLLRDNRLLLAIANVALSVILGLSALWLGRVLIK